MSRRAKPASHKLKGRKKMKKSKFALLMALTVATAGAWAKLPAPSEEAQAKAAEAKVKAAETAKAEGEQLGAAQDRVAQKYIGEQKAKGVIVKATPIAPPAPPAAIPVAAPAPVARPKPATSTTKYLSCRYQTRPDPGPAAPCARNQQTTRHGTGSAQTNSDALPDQLLDHALQTVNSAIDLIRQAENRRVGHQKDANRRPGIR